MQKVTDAFGQTMDLVCVNNEVLFSFLLRGSFGVPGANFKVVCSEGPDFVFYLNVKKNNLVLWFPASECTRAVVWAHLRWILKLQARVFLCQSYFR